jgi:PPOX class probable F420-dependent enzyme
VRLDPDEARRRFAAAPVARLATLRDGAPRIVPVVFAVAGDTVYTAVDHKPKTTRALRRLDDIRRDPQVCLLVDRYDDDWDQLWWVRALGRAAVLDGREGVDLLLAKYRQYRDRAPGGPVVRVDVWQWSGWSAEPGA